MTGLPLNLYLAAPPANGPMQWAVLSFGVLTILYIALIRPLRKGKSRPDPLERKPTRASLAQQRAVERDMGTLLVQYEEMIRRMTAQVDIRSTKLEMLIRDAEEKIAQLKALTGAANAAKGQGDSAGSTGSTDSTGSPQAGSPQAGSQQADSTGSTSSPQAGSPQAGSPQPGSTSSPQTSSPQAGSPQAGSPQASSPQAGSTQPGSPSAGPGKASDDKAAARSTTNLEPGMLGPGEMAPSRPVEALLPDSDGTATGKPGDELDPAGRIDDRHADIYRLADGGQTPRQIARELNRPHGEVELILRLRYSRQGSLWEEPPTAPPGDSLPGQAEAFRAPESSPPGPVDPRRKGRKKQKSTGG